MTDYNAVEILLVEDNPNDAELTMRALEKCKVVNPIHVVADGAEALDFLFCRGAYRERASNNRLKVVLLDLKLPKVDGIEVLRQIKSADGLRLLPVVVLTSSREDPDIVRCYQLGVNSYIVKPVEFSSFIDAVSTLGLYWLLLNQKPGG
jgi:two-component system, response regulator